MFDMSLNPTRRNQTKPKAYFNFGKVTSLGKGKFLIQTI